MGWGSRGWVTGWVGWLGGGSVSGLACAQCTWVGLGWVQLCAMAHSGLVHAFGMTHERCSTVQYRYSNTGRLTEKVLQRENRPYYYGSQKSPAPPRIYCNVNSVLNLKYAPTTYDSLLTRRRFSTNRHGLLSVFQSKGSYFR